MTSQLLEMIASGRPLREVLEAVCRSFEGSAPGCLGGVFPIDWTGPTFHDAVAPSLPVTYLAAIEGLDVRGDATPYAVVAEHKEPVVVGNVDEDPRWRGSAYRTHALAHGLRAVWSVPILSLNQDVLGAFCIYRTTPAVPSSHDFDLAAQLAHVAGIALQREAREAQVKHAKDVSGPRDAAPALTINTIPVLAWSAKTDGSADFLNAHYLQYIGMSAEQALGWGWAASVHPDDVASLTVTWQRILQSRLPGEAEARIRRHDGIYRWFMFRAYPLHDEGGEIVRWCGVNADIEDRKHVEDSLRKSERFLLEVQRVSHTGGWRYDVATNTVETSPELERIYDVQPGEDPSSLELWVNRIHPDDRVHVAESFQRAIRERSAYHLGSRIVRPDGSLRYQYAVGHPVLDDAGNLVELIGATIDMTEQWQSNNELQRTSEALRELEATMARAAQAATVAELAASIAHEVNQPLAGIITNTSTCRRMLDAEPPNLEVARETVKRTIRDADRASEVISRLRALFNKKPFTLESFDLNDATREVVDLTLSDLHRKRVSVQSELADGLPSVTGDRIQLQQVILNLLRNGADAMAGVTSRPRRLVISTTRARGERVVLMVRDAGVGLDPMTVNRLFDAFFSTKSGGMGIGLSISRSIIERHHGRIWAAANDDVGATFAFEIPFLPPDDSATSAPAIG
jgi:PAS domain S-box-containing protein